MEKTTHISFQKTFYALACLALLIAALYFGKGFFVPFSFALLLSCILMPVVRWLVKKGMGNIWAIILTFLALFIVSFGIIYLFSTQINNLIADVSEVFGNSDKILQQAINQYNKHLGFLPDLTMSNIDDKAMSLLKNSGGSLFSGILGSASNFVTNFILTLVFTFMLLLYRKGLKHGILNFFPPEKQEPMREALHDAQKVGTKYLSGLFTVMVILAVVNAGALFAIGVDFAIMFALLGAILVIIPYVGSFLGAILPAIYALATMDVQSALLVLGAFTLIQVIEGNALTPKIVGDSTKVNPLVSITVLLIGGFIWGVPGMILGLPMTAMANRVFAHIEELRPLSHLISSKVAEDDFTVSQKNKVLDN